MNVIDVLVKQTHEAHSCAHKLLDSSPEKHWGDTHDTFVEYQLALAISWNIKHTMWHCCQIATIKRLIHGVYDYVLPKLLGILSYEG